MRTPPRPAFCIVLALAVLAAWGSARPADPEQADAVEARLLADVKFLASPECEGRGLGTQGLDRAADHLVAAFQKAGLKPAAGRERYFQGFGITHGVAKLKEATATLVDPKGKERPLVAESEFAACSVSASGKVTAPLVFVGFGATLKEPAYDDYAGLDVKGKAVVVLRRLPRWGEKAAPDFPVPAQSGAALLEKIRNAQRHQAAAVVFVNDATMAAEGADTLMPFSYLAGEPTPADIPVLHLSRDWASQMLRDATGAGLAAVERSIRRDLKPASTALAGWTCTLDVKIDRTPVAVKNVVGVLAGAGPLADETVVVGAHYDHLGFGEPGSLAGPAAGKAMHPGADDNASGVACLLELARRFGAESARKGRRLVFTAFTGEERGLYGSRHYCENPLFPLADTVAMVNLDTVGRLRDDKLTVAGVGTAREFEPYLDTLNNQHRFALQKVKSGVGPSDHTSFTAKKVPVLSFTTGVHPEYHKPGDTAETINVAGVRRITDMVEETVRHLATVNPPPTFVALGPPVPGGAGPRLGIIPEYDDRKEGVLLAAVVPGGPADKGGLQKGDRIVDLDGQPTGTVQAYMAVLARAKRGEPLEVVFVRDGKEHKVTVKPE